MSECKSFKAILRVQQVLVGGRLLEKGVNIKVCVCAELSNYKKINI